MTLDQFRELKQRRRRRPSISGMCRAAGVPVNTVTTKMAREGMTAAEAIADAVLKRNRQPLTVLCAAAGVSVETVGRKIRRTGMTAAEAIAHTQRKTHAIRCHDDRPKHTLPPCETRREIHGLLMTWGG